MPGFISTQATAEKQYQTINQCIHKWGARFALAPGPNSEIAKAVVYRCEGAVADYNRLRVSERNPISAPERTALDEELLSMALMRVVQERAGQCALEADKK
jgi:hypothetical protein